MTHNELTMLQALPLEIKVMKTQARIREFVERFGINGVYVSYSGGKDSEVLVDICKKMYPNIQIVFSNTGQEYPETVRQVMKRKRQGYNIEILKPKLRFKDVIKQYGYPAISKEQSQYIYEVKNTSSEKLKNLRMKGDKKGGFKISEKWKYLINSDLNISHKCCYVLKKEPMKTYESKTKRKPIVGVMAGESERRKTTYLKTGCNSFEGNAQSKPLGFWKESDIWEYIETTNLEISECYTKHGMKRTGCYGCLFGCHLEERATGTNRIVNLKKTHRRLYDHLMNDLDYKRVMKVLKLKTEIEEQQKLF